MQLLLNEVARIERTMQGLVDFIAPTTSNPRQQDIRGAVAARRSRSSRAEGGFAGGGDSLRSGAPKPCLRPSIAIDFVAAHEICSSITLDASPEGSTVEVSSAGRKRRYDQSDGKRFGAGARSGYRRQTLHTVRHVRKPSGTWSALTIARKIAQEHGGELTVTSRAEAGTDIFTLILPKTRP